MRRAFVVGIISTLVVTATPGVAAATTSILPPPNWYHPTLSQAKSGFVGRSLGPNAYTSYGKYTITGWTVSGKYTVPVSKVIYVSPVVAPGYVASGMHPDSWYNPTTWDWGHILGSTWSAIWNNCLKGATAGVVGSASVTTATNLLARGGKLFVGPEGYAVIAFGGCVTNLVFGN